MPSMEPRFRRSLPERRAFLNLMAVKLELGNEQIRRGDKPRRRSGGNRPWFRHAGSTFAIHHAPA